MKKDKPKTRHVHGMSLDDSVFDFIKDIAKKESRSNSAQMERILTQWVWGEELKKIDEEEEYSK